MEIAAAVLVSRWLGLAAAALLFGAPFFLLYGSRLPAPWMRPLMIAASVGGLCAALLALPVMAAQMSGEAARVVDLETIRAVVFETYSGTIWQIRLGLVMAAFVAAWLAPSQNAWRIQATIGALLVASLAWLGHGGEGGVVHRFADAAHALAASAWIGALAVLTKMLLDASDSASLTFSLNRFSGVGPAIVSVLLLTGIVNSVTLFGSHPLLEALATDYGCVLLAKIDLFAVMLFFAAANRFWLTPRLNGEGAVRATQALRLSLIAETTLAALVLAAAAALGAMEPPSTG